MTAIIAETDKLALDKFGTIEVAAFMDGAETDEERIHREAQLHYRYYVQFYGHYNTDAHEAIDQEMNISATQTMRVADNPDFLGAYNPSKEPAVVEQAIQIAMTEHARHDIFDSQEKRSFVDGYRQLLSRLQLHYNYDDKDLIAKRDSIKSTLIDSAHAKFHKSYADNSSANYPEILATVENAVASLGEKHLTESDVDKMLKRMEAVVDRLAESTEDEIRLDEEAKQYKLTPELVRMKKESKNRPNPIRKHADTPLAQQMQEVAAVVVDERIQVIDLILNPGDDLAVVADAMIKMNELGITQAEIDARRLALSREEAETAPAALNEEVTTDPQRSAFIDLIVANPDDQALREIGHEMNITDEEIRQRALEYEEEEMTRITQAAREYMKLVNPKQEVNISDLNLADYQMDELHTVATELALADAAAANLSFLLNISNPNGHKQDMIDAFQMARRFGHNEDVILHRTIKKTEMEIAKLDGTENTDLARVLNHLRRSASNN